MVGGSLSISFEPAHTPVSAGLILPCVAHCTFDLRVHFGGHIVKHEAVLH